MYVAFLAFKTGMLLQNLLVTQHSQLMVSRDKLYMSCKKHISHATDKQKQHLLLFFSNMSKSANSCTAGRLPHHPFQNSKCAAWSMQQPWFLSSNCRVAHCPKTKGLAAPQTGTSNQLENSHHQQQAVCRDWKCVLLQEQWIIYANLHAKVQIELCLTLKKRNSKNSDKHEQPQNQIRNCIIAC